MWDRKTDETIPDATGSYERGLRSAEKKVERREAHE